MELLPSWFEKASAIWWEVSKLLRGAGLGVSLDTPQIALAQDGGSFIKAYQSRESHGKIGGLCTVYCNTAVGYFDYSNVVPESTKNINRD